MNTQAIKTQWRRLRIWFSRFVKPRRNIEITEKARPLRIIRKGAARPPAERQAPVNRKRTIADTLAGLDSSFNALQKGDINQSWVCKKTRNALRRLGPFVPPPDYWVDTNWRMKDRSNAPSLVFVATRSFFTQESEAKDIVHPAYFYAKKCEKKPAICQYTNGLIYECGAAFEDADKLFWVMFFVSVSRDGVLRPVPYVYPQMVRLPNGAMFARKQSGYGSIEGWAREMNKEPKDHLASIASMCFSFWSMKDRMWRVSSTKDGQRMNFAIDTHETKHYFKDRDKQGVCTSSGRLRPIAHYVSEHARKLSEDKSVVVKEHIRGLRRFTWGGYQIKIQSPRFGGVFADSFTGSAVDDDEADNRRGHLLFIDNAVERLIDIEEAA